MNSIAGDTDCQKVNCPEGAREATLGCVGLRPPRNDTVTFGCSFCYRCLPHSTAEQICIIGQLLHCHLAEKYKKTPGFFAVFYLTSGKERAKIIPLRKSTGNGS